MQWCFKIALGAPWLAPHNVRGNFTTSLGCILGYCVCILVCILVYYMHLMMLANFTTSYRCMLVYYVCILMYSGVHTGALCVQTSTALCCRNQTSQSFEVSLLRLLVRSNYQLVNLILILLVESKCFCVIVRICFLWGQKLVHQL